MTSTAGPQPHTGSPEFSSVVMEIWRHGSVTSAGGLELRLDGVGLTVRDPGAGGGHAFPWEDLLGARCGQPARFADGTPAVTLSAVYAEAPVRWLIPSAQLPPGMAEAIDEVLAQVTPRPAPAEAAEAPDAPPPVGAPVGAPEGITPAPLSDPRSTRGRHSRPTAWVVPLPIVVALVVLVALALAIPFLNSTTKGRPPATTTPGGGQQLSASGAHQIAAEANLIQADLPDGWTVDTSKTGPLSGFLGGGAATGRDSPSATPKEAKISRQFQTCLGTGAVSSHLFGSSGPSALARAYSPAFAQSSSGGGLEEVGSSTAVYASVSAVDADVALIVRPTFPRCFGAAIGQSFEAQATTAAPSGATYGTPEIQPLTVPQLAGAKAAAVELAIPVTQGGATVDITLQFVLVGGGHVEASLFSVSIGKTITAGLTRKLTGDLESRVSSVGSGVGA